MVMSKKAEGPSSQEDIKSGAISAGGTSTGSRMDFSDPAMPRLHPLLQSQLRELRARSTGSRFGAHELLEMLSRYYDTVDDERRAMVRSMQLMSDEARSLGVEIAEQGAAQLQVTLDPERLTSRQVTPLDVDRVLRGANVSLQAGALRADSREVLVESGPFVQTARELETLVVQEEGPVLFAAIDAPPMNLIGPELVRDLISLIQRAEADPAVQLLVFKSADPDYFISHVDVTRIGAYRQEAAKLTGEPSLASLSSSQRKPPRHHRARRRHDPVVEAGEEEAQRRAAAEQRQGLGLVGRERTDGLVTFDQRHALGDVVGPVLLEAPGIEADGEVIGEEIVAGEIEVDQARELVVEEEDIVREQVGVDDAVRQILRPVVF